MGLGTDEIQITGADADELAALRARGVDHGGSAIAPFVDREGGWPLRCCLTDSLPGDVVAIVAWCPFPWRGPYAEVGPVAIHADDCLGVVTDGVPHQFLPRRQLLRPYGHDRRIAYEDISIVEGDGSLPRVLADVVTRARIDFVLVRNVLAGCYSFTARALRSPSQTAALAGGQAASRHSGTHVADGP